MIGKTHFRHSIALAWILSSLIARCVVADPLCTDDALDLGPNTVWRHHEQFEKQIFRWRLPYPGIATVDLLAGGAAPALLEARATSCGERAASYWVIEQTPRHLVLAVRSAGTVHLATGGETPPFRLITHFVPTEVTQQILDLDNPGIHATQTSFLVTDDAQRELEVMDPDPDHLRVDIGHLGTDMRARAPAPSTKELELEVVDPDPDSLRAAADGGYLAASFLTLESFLQRKDLELEVVDPDPDSMLVDGFDDPILGKPAFRHVLIFEPICRRSELDDHGDTPSCSTSLPLGQPVTGELANDWNDDRDVFSFRLTRVSKVEIQWTGDLVDEAYELSDAIGQRLAADETASHLAATLSPGRYFFSLQGSAGTYVIRIVAD